MVLPQEVIVQRVGRHSRFLVLPVGLPLQDRLTARAVIIPLCCVEGQEPRV